MFDTAIQGGLVVLPGGIDPHVHQAGPGCHQHLCGEEWSFLFKPCVLCNWPTETRSIL